VVEGGEHEGGDAGEILELGHVDRQHQQMLQGGDRLDVVARRLTSDEGAGLVRGEGGEDADRDAPSDRRPDGARVEHLRPEMGSSWASS
jgi:hypothetical protein